MPTNEDYRLYLEECFKGIHAEMRAEFKNVHDSLDYIKEQTTRTNSRVTHLEEQRDEYLKTRVSADMLTECKVDLSNIKEDLLEYHFFKKYPKIFIGLVAVLAVSMIVGFGLINKNQNKLKEEVDMINSPVVTRSGTVEWYPSGVLIDSMKKQ